MVKSWNLIASVLHGGSSHWSSHWSFIYTMPYLKYGIIIYLSICIYIIYISSISHKLIIGQSAEWKLPNQAYHFPHQCGMVTITCARAARWPSVRSTRSRTRGPSSKINRGPTLWINTWHGPDGPSLRNPEIWSDGNYWKLRCHQVRWSVGNSEEIAVSWIQSAEVFWNWTDRSTKLLRQDPLWLTFLGAANTSTDMSCEQRAMMCHE